VETREVSFATAEPLLHSRDGSLQEWLPGKRERAAADPESAKALVFLRL